MPPPETLVAERRDTKPRVRQTLQRPRKVLIALVGLAATATLLFLTWGVDGHWDFALPRRLEQLAALVVVGVAIAVSTVIFHTLTENHILTPSIMGFDALYVLLATSFVFVIGASAFRAIPDLTMFLINATMLVMAATMLYRWVLSDGTRGLYTLVLVGVIASTLFSSVSSFMFRVMDPNEFDSLMSALFASFSSIDTATLGIGSLLLVIALVASWKMVPTLDVLTLGRERAITLGVEYRPVVTKLLIIVACLVAVSTALVGPITFLGLLVANLAYRLTRTYRHSVTFPAAALVSIVALLLGQAFLQHVLTYSGTIASIINLVGGVYFVLLLVREART